MLKLLKYIASSLLTLVGIVLIWRGIWNLLDAFDSLFLGGNYLFSSIGGIFLGLLLLYLPDKDLKEIRERP